MRREPKKAHHDYKSDKEGSNKKTELRIVDHEYIKEATAYSEFDQLNGIHPWQTAVPEGFIAYQARVLRSAKVAYFNFDLAREMGLIEKDHPNEISKSLEKKLIETFSLQIINEFDIENGFEYPEKDIKQNLYMATRYLQLQHPNKQGKTSGDGRSIWNGFLNNKTGQWDVSSRGTGVTALSPGSVESGKNLQTGQESFGYGCGLAEIDELYATAIMSEIFHQKGIPTERTLLVLDTGPGVGIGVRASKNLLRPAHLFSFLKQSNYDALKRATDYFIERQKANKVWNLKAGSKASYKKLLKLLTKQYAEFAARLESDYIFAWFDWDGDNMLMDVGILDYGSIRQFGICHDEYRYDDVTRYSTNLNEQRQKTRQIIQVFTQMVDYLTTNKKKNLKHFENASSLNDFDSYFEDELNRLFLKKLGISQGKQEEALKKHKKLLSQLYKSYYNLERLKSETKVSPVDDGINKQPLLNTRKLLQWTPQYFNRENLDLESVFVDILAEESGEYSAYQKSSAIAELDSYFRDLDQFLSALYKKKLPQKQWEKNTFFANHPERITGNSITHVVHQILDLRSKSLSGTGLQKFIDMFIYNELKKTMPDLEPPEYNRVPKAVLKKALYIVKEHHEDI